MSSEVQAQGRITQFIIVSLLTSQSSAKINATLVRALEAGDIRIVFDGTVLHGYQPAEYTALAVSIDFGLITECFHYAIPIPEFSTPLNTKICFEKSDICHLADASTMRSAVSEQDQRDVQNDLSHICKKMTATTALCAFVLVSLTLVGLVIIFPTIRKFSCHLANPQLQAGILAVSLIMSMCALIVWGTVMSDGKDLEDHFKSQLLNSDLATMASLEVPASFTVHLSYSFYLQIVTLLLTIAALCLTVSGGIRRSTWLMRAFPGTSRGDEDASHHSDQFRPSKV